MNSKQPKRQVEPRVGAKQTKGKASNAPSISGVESTTLDATLIDAYRQTHYRVDMEASGQTSLVLEVGVENKLLGQLHKQYGVDSSAFITACNPWSQQLSDEENAKRHQLLLAELTKRSLRWCTGVGQHPSNAWSPETSVLVLGLSLESAKVLAGQFEQNALVWNGADNWPQLVLLR